MYSGIMTPKLKKLYIEYDDRFGVYPDHYVQLKYGKSYFKFVRDIETALKENKTLPKLVMERIKLEPGEEIII